MPDAVRTRRLLMPRGDVSAGGDSGAALSCGDSGSSGGSAPAEVSPGSGGSDGSGSAEVFWASRPARVFWVSRAWGLPFASRPAQTCSSTGLPVHVTVPRLASVQLHGRNFLPTAYAGLSG